MFIEFLVTSLIVILLPGTGVLYTITVGLRNGVRMSIFAALGCTFGIVPHVIACLTGLAVLLHASSVAFTAIKYIGVLYLFYMAWMTFKDREGMVIDDEKSMVKRDCLGVVRSGVLLNILNPKLSLFFLAFLPQFVPSYEVNPTFRMMWMALIFMGMTFVVFIGYGVFAAAARQYVISKPSVMAWLRRGFAATFGVLGVRLAID
ncbi:Homoserine/homoserine lactone efflux protein [Poriferisphaera corsica]|uniref:Homoserine/homoserine lactone efflux protein n=1 Tax=Poriferisphaera corsica TaxID=2528020 RepID=A0A517YU29_9BACT|nr:LysE family translocator [Poriferisphaera corsica]QDU33728.1 Homoserine/homoserine lactone efflux protein [Poriferisphaera corsica]